MENTNYLVHQNDSFEGSITERRSTSDYQPQNYPIQQPNLMKRHPKKQSGRDGRETDSRRGYAQDQYRGRGAKPIQRPFPPPKADAEVDNIVTLIKMSNKNYIALLHEYTKKIDRALMFKHDLRADRYHVPKKDIFICQVMIASYGCVAQAEAYTKQWARNLACEIAIDRIIRSNPKARAIIKDLLVKQGTKVLRVVHKIIVTKPEVLNQEVEGYQVQAKTASLWNHLPQSVDSFSLQKALKGEPLIVEKLALFADSLGLRISWKISMQPEGHFQAECTFEGLRAQGLSYNRRSSKVLAVRNLLSLIDCEPTLKHKLVRFLQNPESWRKEHGTLLQIKQAATQIHLLSETKYVLRSLVDSDSVAVNKSRFDTTEQTDLAYRLGQVDKDSSLSQEESKELRDTFDALKQLISLTFHEQPYQLIPLGSFIIGCVSNRNKTIDCYIYFENGFVENTLIGEGLEAALGKQNRNEIELYSVEVSKEDKDTVFFSSLNTGAKVRLVSIQLVQENGETKINRYSASIFHSNWLIENFNKSESAWQVVKLFRLIRVWKEAKQLSFVPTDVLDLALIFATTNLKETNLLLVILKFFSLLQIVLCSHKEEFYDLSEFHCFLINSLTDEQKTVLVETGQKTLTNLITGSIEDFEFR